MSILVEVEHQGTPEDRPVERGGRVYKPGETVQATINSRSALRELTACSLLKTRVLEEHVEPEAPAPEDVSAEREKADELQEKMRAADAEVKRLAGELSKSRTKMAEATAADEQTKRAAASKGEKASSVKLTAPKLESEVEDLRYQRHQARLDALALRRDYHEAMQPFAQAKQRASAERVHAARAAHAEAEQEIYEAQRAHDGHDPDAEGRKARQAVADLRDLEAAGPSGA